MHINFNNLFSENVVNSIELYSNLTDFDDIVDEKWFFVAHHSKGSFTFCLSHSNKRERTAILGQPFFVS